MAALSALLLCVYLLCRMLCSLLHCCLPAASPPDARQESLPPPPLLLTLYLWLSRWPAAVLLLMGAWQESPPLSPLPAQQTASELPAEQLVRLLSRPAGYPSSPTPLSPIHI